MADIAQATGLRRTTVSRELRRDCPPGRTPYGPRSTVRDPYTG